MFKAQKYLDSLEKYKKKFELRTTENALKLFGNPHKKMKIIHVAGTNGKGSTTTLIANILKQAKFRVGKYTSPHLVKLNERIQVNEKPISNKGLNKLIIELKNKIEKYNIVLSFFEFTTALAFIYFYQKKVDFAVIETGLGGRLDATNVCDSFIQIITNIQFDHEQYLGNTLDKIANEKFGIIKKNSTVITTITQNHLLKKLKKVCKKLNCKLIIANKKYKVKILHSTIKKQIFNIKTDNQIRKIEIHLIGKHQINNCLNAIACSDELNLENYMISEKKLLIGLKKSNWLGRFNVIRLNPTIIIDCAHNVAGIKTLIKTLEEHYKKKIIFIISISSDKNAKKMIKLISKKCKKLVLTKYNNERSFDPLKLKEFASNFIANVKINAAPINALKDIIKYCSHKEVICITGSIFLIGELLEKNKWNKR